MCIRDRAYVGTAVKLFNRLSLGVNASYLFGSINHDYSITYPTSQTKVFETFIERDIRVGDIMPVSYTHLDEAITSGVQQGIIFEVDSYIDELRKQYPGLKVIFTGGDAIFFEKKVKNTIFAEPNLVFIGLNRILETNA